MKSNALKTLELTVPNQDTVWNAIEAAIASDAQKNPIVYLKAAKVDLGGE